MSSPQIQFVVVKNGAGEGVKIAYSHAPVSGSGEPGIVWFCGFKSDMASTKVSALKGWAARTSRSILSFDYSGHGKSGGEFTHGTIGQWLNESLAMLRDVARGPQILVGSSMGAWIVLLILRAIARGDPRTAGICPVAGAVLIAPAWDMTEELMWKQFSEPARQALEKDGVYEQPSRYGDGPYAITRALIEDGRRHLIGGDSFEPPCPVRILQGVQDPDVPWQHAEKLMGILKGDNVTLTLIPDGDHRLSRDRDIAKLTGLLEDLNRSLRENPR